MDDELRFETGRVIEELSRPLSVDDLECGWTEEVRTAWVDTLETARTSLGTDAAKHASFMFHTGRWMDYDGIDTGALRDQVLGLADLWFGRLAPDDDE